MEDKKPNGEANFCSIKDFFNNFKSSLAIPYYQRPYTWSENQISQLLDDLEDAWKNNKNYYLIGNIILHYNENGQKYNIVDGQQRLITFKIMEYIYKKLKNNSSEVIDEDGFLSNKISLLSYEAIAKNRMLIENRFNYLLKREKLNNLYNYIQKNVYLSYITTSSLDEAFLFFDSQNSRGKKLLQKDVLKVHHLRHMRYEEKIDQNEIKKIAKLWEEYEKLHIKDEEFLKYIKNDEDMIEFLLDQLLGICRKGTRRILNKGDIGKIDVYEEFKSQGVSPYLNNYNQPPLFQSYEYDISNDLLQLTTKCAVFTGAYQVKGLQFLPFEITQSIAGGKAFFLYVFKYMNILKELSKNQYFSMLDGVSGTGNLYIRKIYRSTLIYFYDKFGYDHFDEFAMKIYLLLLFYRLRSDSVGKNSIVKFEWQEKHKLNLFESIYLNYSPHHIFKEIDEYVRDYCQIVNNKDVSDILKKMIRCNEDDKKEINNCKTKKTFFNQSNNFKALRDKIILEFWGVVL